MASLKNTTINDTGYLQLPVGTTAQRPGSPVNGDTRFNSQFKVVESYVDGVWKYMPPIVEGGLVLHLDAAEPASYPGTGTTWTDLSGNGNNGTLVNGPTYNSSNGGSILFDGSNDYASVSDSSSLSFGLGLTLSGWFNAQSFDASPIENAIIRKQNQWALQTIGNSGIRCLIWTNGTTGWTAANDVSYSFSTSTWYNMTLTWDGSVMRIFVNTQQVKTATVTGSIVDNSNLVRISSDEGNNTYANFLIPHVSIYNRALSASEIQQNFNALRGRYGL